jgi:hypothetical protein
MSRDRATYKTYSHLLDKRRRPTPYEVMSTGVLYSVTHPPAVRNATTEWYQKYGQALHCENWERFADPRSMTYAKYTALQREKEMFVDGLLRSMEDLSYDASLPLSWRSELATFLSAARFPVHGLQMAAAYIGQLAPSGRIAMTCLFQCADEIRRVQRIAQRLHLLRASVPQAPEEGRALWMSDPAWQPLRQTVERLLVTYDWGEAFSALNLALKPAFDAFFSSYLLQGARTHRDPLLEELVKSLREDSHWQIEWSDRLHALLAEENESNALALGKWQGAWESKAKAAMQSLSLSGNARMDRGGSP